jgi:uncharacterized protein YjfI (DUF2170 family)
MFEEAVVTSTSKKSLEDFLHDHGFIVEDMDGTVLSVKRPGELPIFISLSSSSLFFEVDLGNISAFANADLYYAILDLNTEILPVSVGIDSTEKEDPHLVLVETRELANLDDNEVLSVLDAMEIAVDKVEELLSKYVK